MNPIHYILFLLLGTFFAVLGVAQRANADHLGYRIGKVKAQQERLVEENRQLLCEISALSHPARIADEIGRLNIALVDPVAFTKGPLTEEAEAKAADKHRAEAKRQLMPVNRRTGKKAKQGSAQKRPSTAARR